MIRFYGYSGCGSCRKAKKWLQLKNLDIEEVAIRDTPPSFDEFREALSCGYGLKALFNSSGMDYRELKMKDKWPTLSDDEALGMLQSRGNLVKRPFVVTDKGVLVGFKEEAWEAFFTQP